VEIVKTIINAFPRDANKKDKFGRTVIEILSSWHSNCIQRALSFNMDTINGRRCHSRLDLLRMKSNNAGGIHILEVFWEKASILIKAAYYESNNKQNNPTLGCNIGHVLHACVGVENCPSNIIELAMKLHPEQLCETDAWENYPLHIAASNRTLNGREICLCDEKFTSTTSIPANSLSEQENLVSRLVQLYPSAAKKPSGKGMMPLQLAVISGKKWHEGVCSILKAAVDIVMQPVMCNGTRIYPFMLAAVGDTSCLTTVYELLRHYPELRRFETSANV